MKHKAQFGWIGRTQKTVKTECGKRIACSQIAIDADTDCPACRAAVDAHCAAADEFVRRYGAHEAATAARQFAGDPNRYRTIYFL